jgi:hypothetical protein
MKLVGHFINDATQEHINSMLEQVEQEGTEKSREQERGYHK